MTDPLNNVSKEQLLHAIKMMVASVEVQQRICFVSGVPVPAQDAMIATVKQGLSIIEMATGNPVDIQKLLNWALIELRRMEMEQGDD